jgi:hypothetical protein
MPCSFQYPRLDLLIHVLDRARDSNGTQIRPVLVEDKNSKLVVSVSVGDVYVA